MAFERTSRALNNAINSFARGEVNDISNPALRFGANKLLDTFLGDPDYADNVFNKAFANEQRALVRETDTIIKPIDSSPTVTAQSVDWRARLRPKRGGESQFYGRTADDGSQDWLLKPIQESGGLVWQYTPNITIQGSANYNSTDAQGQNYPINTFNNSAPPQIPINSDFTANDLDEARYLLAVMTFLKVATKGYYGDQSVAAGTNGTPPPVLLFEYLGEYGFNKVPVVVTNYDIQYPNNVDYVPVEFRGTVTYVPTETNINVLLVPSYTPHKLRKQFNLSAITNGTLYNQGFI